MEHLNCRKVPHSPQRPRCLPFILHSFDNQFLDFQLHLPVQAGWGTGTVCHQSGIFQGSVEQSVWPWGLDSYSPTAPWPAQDGWMAIPLTNSTSRKHKPKTTSSYYDMLQLSRQIWPKNYKYTKKQHEHLCCLLSGLGFCKPQLSS